MCYNSDLVHSIYSEYTQRDRPAGDGVGNTAIRDMHSFACQVDTVPT